MSQVSQSNQSPDSDLTTANSADCRDDIVRTYDLTKRYGDFTALDHCNVAVPRNEIFGLLGPNGAGKSTLIRLMLGFLTPTHGRCELDGCDAMVDGVALRRRVAYLPGDARLPTHMRGAGVMRFFADMHPFGDLNRSREVAELLELDTSRRVGFMSTGMRQKLALSVVFGLTTPLLILDEPTANLDPTVRGAVLQLVLDAQNEGRTIIFSSHVLSEIEDTCDQVVFLRQGLLAHQLRMRELFQRHRITADSNGPSIEVPSELGNRVEVREVKHGASKLLQIDTAGDLGPILTWINSLQLEHVRAEPLGLRTVYDSVHDGTKIE